MTRSTRSAPTYKQAKKAFKQKAIEAGCDYKPYIHAAWNQAVAEATRDKARRPPLHCVRNPRRMDGAKWNGSAFICPGRVEDGVPELTIIDERWDDSDGYEDSGKEEEEEEEDHRTEVCLMDIARPAKPRGVKKEFEVVDKLPGVIVLEDDEEVWEFYGDWWEEDWEEIFVEGAGAKRSFAEVLRTGG